MTLSISIATAAIILRFTTPDATGTYYLFSHSLSHPGAFKVEASGYATNAQHVAVSVPCVGDRVFSVRFDESRLR